MNETESSDSGNTTLASGSDTNVGPTAGDTRTLQTQVSNNNPVDSGTLTPSTVNEGANNVPTVQDNAANSGTPLDSGTVIAQGDIPNNSAFNPVSDAVPAGPIDSNSAVPPQQMNKPVASGWGIEISNFR